MFQKKEKAAKIKTQKFKKEGLFKNLSCLFFDGCKNEEEENLRLNYNSCRQKPQIIAAATRTSLCLSEYLHI